MKLRIIFVLMLGFLLITITPISNAQEESSFRYTDCPFEIPPEVDVIECGYLTVPENWEEPDGNQVELAVAILLTANIDFAPDPVVYLAGGPGGNSLDSTAWFAELPFIENRDVILFDQRGTGYSVPSLECNGGLEELEVCYDEFTAQGIDLSQYNSANSARDLNALRQALGYEQINLVGISYGTRLGLTIMRDYPDMVRSAVLDSVYPPNVDTSYITVPDIFNILIDIFDDCTADEACNAAYPDLEERFSDALITLNETLPLVTDSQTGEEFPLDVSTVFASLNQQLSNSINGFAMPAAFDALANGNYQLYYELANYGAQTGLTQGIEFTSLEQIGEQVLEQLTDEELDQLIELLATGDVETITAFISSLFSRLDNPQSVAVLFLQWFNEDPDEGEEFDLVALEEEVFAIIDALTDEEITELETIIIETEDPEAIGNYIASLFEVSDPLILGYIFLELYNADFETGELPADIAATLDSSSDGMNASVQCYEELSPFDFETAYQLAIDQGIPQFIVDSTISSVAYELAICEFWDVGEAPAIEYEAVVSDIPTLILNGEYDALTPPSWAILAGETLSNSEVFILSKQGHSVLGTAGICPPTLAQNFLNDPMGELDTSCLEAFNPQFLILDQ